MDSTGGDLTHAAKELDEKIEARSLPSSSGSTNNVVGEKQEQDVHSSGSSSQDATPMEKLDSRVVKVRDAKEGDEAYAHLPDHEREIVKRQLEIPPVTVTFKTLYRYATRNDLIIIVVSSICAIVGGAVMPLMTVSLHVPGRNQILTYVIDHLRSTSGDFPKLLQWHKFSCRVHLESESFHPVFYLFGNRRICHHIHLHSRLHLLGRTYHPKD